MPPARPLGESTQKKAMGLLSLVVVGVVAGALSVNALAIVGIEGATANKVINAILAGMDIAAALSIFGGVTAIAGWALFLLKQALRKASKKAIAA